MWPASQQGKAGVAAVPTAVRQLLSQALVLIIDLLSTSYPHNYNYQYTIVTCTSLSFRNSDCRSLAGPLPERDVNQYYP